MTQKKLYNNTLIYGITKVRNEELIIKETLDYYAQFCNKIFTYDDCSSDQTVKISEIHPAVHKVIKGKKWNKDRYQAEHQTRQAVLEEAQKGNPDWIVYFDADERIEFPDIDLSKYDGVKMKLFDYYITEEDKDKHYTERQFIGPEYREILMMYRNLPNLKYEHADQREMVLPLNARIAYQGYVKHYGKAVSVEQWEETCNYYSTYWEEPYKSKWEARKGKAVHTKSDFGAKLITWDQKDDYGYPLL